MEYTTAFFDSSLSISFIFHCKHLLFFIANIAMTMSQINGTIKLSISANETTTFLSPSQENMHKKTFLRTKRPYLCIFITKYLGNTQKNATFAVVFVPNWTIHIRIFELEEDNLSTKH